MFDPRKTILAIALVLAAFSAWMGGHAPRGNETVGVSWRGLRPVGTAQLDRCVRSDSGPREDVLACLADDDPDDGDEIAPGPSSTGAPDPGWPAAPSPLDLKSTVDAPRKLTHVLTLHRFRC